MASCPSCGGRQLTGQPQGWLATAHTVTCPLRDHEDSTRENDVNPWGSLFASSEHGAIWHNAYQHIGAPAWERPATDTERTLLSAYGYNPPAVGDVLLTLVIAYAPPAIFARAWPDLVQITWKAGITVGYGQRFTFAGVELICVGSGTTGTSQPTAPAAEGGTVTDGTVVWLRA